MPLPLHTFTLTLTATLYLYDKPLPFLLAPTLTFPSTLTTCLYLDLNLYLYTVLFMFQHCDLLLWPRPRWFHTRPRPAVPARLHQHSGSAGLHVLRGERRHVRRDATNGTAVRNTQRVSSSFLLKVKFIVIRKLCNDGFLWVKCLVNSSFSKDSFSFLNS